MISFLEISSQLFLVVTESLTLQQAIDSLLDNNNQSIIQNEGKIHICDQVAAIAKLQLHVPEEGKYLNLVFYYVLLDIYQQVTFYRHLLV